MPYLMNLVHLLQRNNPLTTGSLRICEKIKSTGRLRSRLGKNVSFSESVTEPRS